MTTILLKRQVKPLTVYKGVCSAVLMKFRVMLAVAQGDTSERIRMPMIGHFGTLKDVTNQSVDSVAHTMATM